MTCTSEDMLDSLDPAATTARSEMGPVIYVDGATDGRDTEAMRTFNSQDLDVSRATVHRRREQAAQAGHRAPEGQMSFHHCRMVHGSDVNHGDRPRTSIALRLQDRENRYRIS